MKRLLCRIFGHHWISPDGRFVVSRDPMVYRAECERCGAEHRGPHYRLPCPGGWGPWKCAVCPEQGSAL